MLGASLDIPIAVAILTGIFIKNTPLAVLLTAMSVIIVADTLGLNTMYRQHAIHSQIFICIDTSRIAAKIRHRSSSDLIKNEAWIYDRLKAQIVDWNWSSRANTLANKSTRAFNILAFICCLLISLSSISSAIISYNILWLGYYCLYLSPLLFTERLSRLIYSWRKSNGVENLTSTTKQNLKSKKNI